MSIIFFRFFPDRGIYPFVRLLPQKFRYKNGKGCCKIYLVIDEVKGIPSFYSLCRVTPMVLHNNIVVSSDRLPLLSDVGRICIFPSKKALLWEMVGTSGSKGLRWYGVSILLTLDVYCKNLFHSRTLTVPPSIDSTTVCLFRVKSIYHRGHREMRLPPRVKIEGE